MAEHGPARTKTFSWVFSGIWRVLQRGVGFQVGIAPVSVRRTIRGAALSAISATKFMNNRGWEARSRAVRTEPDLPKQNLEPGGTASVPSGAFWRESPATSATDPFFLFVRGGPCSHSVVSMPWLTATEGGIIIRCHVVPRASKSAVDGLHGDALKIRLQAPPVEGKANKALAQFVAALLGVPVRNVRLAAGEKSRSKRLFVAGGDEADVRRRLST